MLHKYQDWLDVLFDLNHKFAEFSYQGKTFWKMIIFSGIVSGTWVVYPVENKFNPLLLTWVRSLNSCRFEWDWLNIGLLQAPLLFYCIWFISFVLVPHLVSSVKGELSTSISTVSSRVSRESWYGKKREIFLRLQVWKTSYPSYKYSMYLLKYWWFLSCLSSIDPILEPKWKRDFCFSPHAFSTLTGKEGRRLIINPSPLRPFLQTQNVLQNKMENRAF